jgi:cytoskeletal protein CcmA (bactofilin family)
MLSIFKKETPAITESISNIKDLVNEGNDYFSDELIILDEQLTANLFCAENVVIEQHGVLTGNITSKTCQVAGIVNGNITSLDLLDIKATAVVRGNIASSAVNIEPGAVINGYITVGEDIEGLTEQWNRTKFSTHEHLITDKLNKELAALSNISAATVIAEVKAEPTLASTETKLGAIVEAQATAQKPLVAAATATAVPEPENKEPVAKPKLSAAAPPKKEEAVNNERWW